MQPENNKQNVSIARLDERIKSLEERFNRFMINDFAHLQKRMEFLVALVVISILIPILLYILKI